MWRKQPERRWQRHARAAARRVRAPRARAAHQLWEISVAQYQLICRGAHCDAEYASSWSLGGAARRRRLFHDAVAVSGGASEHGRRDQGAPVLRSCRPVLSWQRNGTAGVQRHREDLQVGTSSTQSRSHQRRYAVSAACSRRKGETCRLAGAAPSAGSAAAAAPTRLVWGPPCSAG